MPPDRHTVLIIDDDPSCLETASMLLARYAFRVLSARDGEVGLRRARLGQPDLIVLDLDMPGIDGFETCRRLKANPETAAIPVLFTTGHVGAAEKVRAFELGGADYITKPFEAPVFLARVVAHLTLHSQRRALAAQAEQLDARIAEATEALATERSRLSQALVDRERLQSLLELQGDQLRRLTRAWLTSHDQEDAALARYLRTDLRERLQLLAGVLAQAARRGQAGADDLAEAQALLRPALQSADRAGATLSGRPPLAENPLVRLSAREHQVFEMLIEGRSNKEICLALGLQSTTVSTYRRRILEKLEVENVPALVRLAVRFPRPTAAAAAPPSDDA